MSGPESSFAASLLAIADDLAVYRGNANLRQAAMRRAVSNAYYAVFHTICFVCADSLVSRRKPELIRTLYRSIDHGPVKRHLLSAAARTISLHLPKIGDLFAGLQQHRHAADYEPAAALFDRHETLTIIATARLAITLILQLDDDARTRLAILLLVNKRTA